MNLNEIEEESIELSNAIKGLEIFVNHRFTGLGEIRYEDLGALTGLTAVLSRCADLHNKNVMMLNSNLEKAKGAMPIDK